MLELAIKYENQLKEKLLNIMLDEEFMFMFSSSYREEIIVDKSTWNRHQFVSVNPKGEVVGYFKYNIDRDSLNCHAVQIVNFHKDKISRCFINDLKQVIKNIFEKYGFNKLSFGVHIGNPAEKMYDKHLHLIGGRIVGTKMRDDKLMDGNYYNYKLYEVLKEEYINVMH